MSVRQTMTEEMPYSIGESNRFSHTLTLYRRKRPYGFILEKKNNKMGSKTVPMGSISSIAGISPHIVIP